MKMSTQCVAVVKEEHSILGTEKGNENKTVMALYKSI